MAMVLDAFASYVQNMLTEMANEEVHMLLGVREEIEKMDIKLGDLKNFLADADRRNITHKTVQAWVAELKHAMYEAADILDLCQLKAMEQGQSTIDVGCFNRLLFCMRNPAHAHKIGTRIKELNKKLGTIKERGDAFNFINLSSYEDRNSRVHASHSGIRSSRETSGEFDRSGVVGEKIEEDTRAIFDIMLTEKEGNANIMVVAIVGVGGIGKTTLAQKVFKDETVNAEFDKTIWLSVNQNFDKVELIKTVITLAGGEYGGGTALAVLQPILTATVKGKKLFIVMDDVWIPTACSDVFGSHLANVVAQGSRILVTTRDERVARGMKAMLPYHRVDKLEEDDGWSLLKNQIVSCETDGHEIDTLKDIGIQIVAKCDGLPLAIKVLGGLLCQKEKKHHEWKMVLDDSIWSVNEMPEELNHAVYLSYEDLPSCIKQCLLYYSLIPKTATFYIDDIVGMWIGEGFLHGTSDNLEDVGTKYYKELIVRNLIEPNARYLDQSVCTMHDIVRSFAQFVSRDEALVAHSGETNIGSKLSAHKFLRLSLESKSSESDGLDWSSLQTQTILRTLILVGHINMNSADLLANFPSLRTLYAASTGVGELAESLHEFKHLRYLSLEYSDITSLPDNLGKLKFLQFINLYKCEQFVELPHSIVQLSQLRHLRMGGTSISGISRGLCVLTNLRSLIGFPAIEDGDWCSLEELGPLYQLTQIGLLGLENVTAPSSAAKAKLGEKVHLTTIELSWHVRLGDDGKITEEEKENTEKVIDELCPPPNIDFLSIAGYFGRRLPTWMMSSSVVSLKILRILMIEDLVCCTVLPNGLCQLPYLEFIQIDRAPAIKRVGLEFMRSNHHQSLGPSHLTVAFPKVHQMNLIEMVEWEEWDWVEAVQAFPVLRELVIQSCKVTSLPPGLSSQASSLNKLDIGYVKALTYVENFPTLIRLEVDTLPDLKMITNLGGLKILIIKDCPKLKVLEGVPALQTLLLNDGDMETLPEYMGCINPGCLELHCSLALLYSIAAGPSGHEWDKFSHIERVKAYAREGNMVKKWYVLYTTNPYNLETNVSRSFMSTGSLSCFEDEQRFEYVFKMTRKTFSYICSLVFGPSMEDMNSYTFIDARVLCLEDRVAIALRRLYSSEPSETLGSSVGVSKSTVLLVAEKFVDAVLKRAAHHLSWPNSSKKDEIKSTFGKIHNLHNCCGVICTTHIPFGQNCYHAGENGRILMQAVIDPKMRIMDLGLGSMDSITQLSIFHDSTLFKECEKGGWLNGSKLKVASDGSEVGEYLIGDEGYPLLPWLLTPYQEENLSDSKAEFNRRHSAATTWAQKALSMLQEKWKCLQEDVWWPENLQARFKMIQACCRLHNIVIDMEDDAEMPSANAKHWNYKRKVRLVANEDAVRARDMLSQYFLTSRSSEAGICPADAVLDPEVAASGAGDEDKEQEAQTRTADEVDNDIQDIIV
ncbi:putative disease resistance protein RGA4 [Lolium rigidum]|uniref:putative disease resistance protein RGA4 n=1 Tax=Lolium rigidum TaxID=89674 RepID=UPI001F5D91DF|nr:putative disease resistance protein RGA4 [Lolium rigidum]